jgi:hypothetical protein
VTDIAQEDRLSQVEYGRQGTAGTGSHEQAVRNRRLSRMPDAVHLDLGCRVQQMRRKADTFKLALARREPQKQAAMFRLAGQTLRRKTDAVNLALAGREPQKRAVMRGQALAEFAQDVRRCHFVYGRQGTAGACKHEQAVSGRRCAECQTQSIVLTKSGNRRRLQ